MAKGIFELEEYKQIVDRENVLLIDGLNLAFRYKHAGTSSFAGDYLKTVNSLAKSYGAKHVIVLSDWGKSSYRKELYPDYKGDREEKILSQTPEEKEFFELFIEEFNSTLEICNQHHTVFKFKGVEADDLAAYIAKFYLRNFNNHIWLVSSDKDWDMLIDDNISRFSYVTRKEYTKENWNEHYDFPLEHLLSIKVLEGGKDNVKGIDGIGIKRAASLVEKYGSAFDIYDELPLAGSAKYIQNLNLNGETILLNMLLMDKITYCKEAIGKENITEINKKLEELCIL
jgi:5'-3' exonuclease